MSTRWESTIIEGPRGVLDLIAQPAASLIPRVFKQRLAIAATASTSNPELWTVKCMGFRSGDLALTAGEIPPTIPGLEKHARSADLALARIASCVVGTAYWVCYTDSLGIFACAKFLDGMLESTFTVEATVEDPQRHHLAAVHWFRKYFPDLQSIDDELFQAFEGESAKIGVGV